MHASHYAALWTGGMDEHARPLGTKHSALGQLDTFSVYKKHSKECSFECLVSPGHKGKVLWGARIACGHWGHLIWKPWGIVPGCHTMYPAYPGTCNMPCLHLHTQSTGRCHFLLIMKKPCCWYPDIYIVCSALAVTLSRDPDSQAKNRWGVLRRNTNSLSPKDMPTRDICTVGCTRNQPGLFLSQNVIMLSKINVYVIQKRVQPIWLCNPCSSTMGLRGHNL